MAYDADAFYINAFDVCIAFDLADRTALFGNASQKIRQFIVCGKPVVIYKNGNNFVEKEQLGSIVVLEDLDSIADAFK